MKIFFKKINSTYLCMPHSHYFSYSLHFTFLPLSRSLSLSFFFLSLFQWTCTFSALINYLLHSSSYTSSLFLHILSFLFVSSTSFSSTTLLTALLSTIYRTFVTIPTLSIFSLELEHSFQIQRNLLPKIFTLSSPFHLFKFNFLEYSFNISPFCRVT